MHTNLHAAFKCDALKLAMIKNEHLANKLFQVALVCVLSCCQNLLDPVRMFMYHP